MTKHESKLIEWIERNRFPLFIAVISCAGILTKIPYFGYESRDYKDFLKIWFDTIKELGGLPALGTNVGNYSMAYQFLISLMTYLPVSSLFCYKALSVIFDFLLAFAAGKFVWVLSGKKDKKLYAIGYAITLLFPTTTANSAVWAQCDSIFSFFCVMSLCFLYENKNIRAFVFLGLALAFKLQAVFILPFFIYFYITEKRFSILHFFISLAAFYATCIPGLICGRGLLDPLKIYFEQTDLYKTLSMNIPNLWSLYNGSGLSGLIGVGIAFAVFGIVLLLLIGKHDILQDPARFIALSAWSCWTAVMLLPHMHERYMYLGDVLLLILAIVNTKYTLYTVSAVITSIITYGCYLGGNKPFGREITIFYILVWTAFSIKLLYEFRKDAHAEA